MSTLVLKDCTTWVDGLALTTFSNEVSLAASVAEVDTTVFGSGGFKSRAGGLKSVEASIKGLLDPSVVDADAFANLGVMGRVATFSTDGLAGSPAYFAQVGNFEHTQGGKIGDVDPFSAKLMGSTGVGLVRGQVAAAKGNVSAIGVLGSGLNLGPVGAGQFVYCAFHVFTPGTTITVQLQSDTTSGFAAPVTVATIGPLTVAGGTWMTRVPGPLTNSWWRLNVSAITGTFNVAGSIAVGS